MGLEAGQGANPLLLRHVSMQACGFEAELAKNQQQPVSATCRAKQVVVFVFVGVKR